MLGTDDQSPRLPGRFYVARLTDELFRTGSELQSMNARIEDQANLHHRLQVAARFSASPSASRRPQRDYCLHSLHLRGRIERLAPGSPGFLLP